MLCSVVLELCTLLIVREFELAGGQLVGRTTVVEGVFVWRTVVGILQLVGCIRVVFGQFVGCTTVVEGPLVGRVVVGILQLVGWTTAVFGARLG
jgi:hypothetical protein